ncbi:hypothetical protein OUZ56_013918 [Daphnia magna]|uniref:Uncharacterized protein n=1 Tax=Daphnia magna TaxID=35525 RepID=A0ABQ9Z7B6_9CRUS|nr:hypothetical protein OUZ56_013918 [Daphnia magna]
MNFALFCSNFSRSFRGIGSICKNGYEETELTWTGEEKVKKTKQTGILVFESIDVFHAVGKSFCLQMTLMRDENKIKTLSSKLLSAAGKKKSECRPRSRIPRRQ